MSALEPLPRLCAPRGSVRPPESICTAVIEHAARNGTKVLLSLLPLDLRIKVDRMHRIVAWHHAGELIIVPNVVIDDADRIPPDVFRFISEGEEVIAFSERVPGRDEVRSEVQRCVLSLYFVLTLC